MATLTHWTGQSTQDFLYRIGADYVAQLERAMEASGTSQDELARELNVTKGRVSQVLNNPGNLGLKNIIEYARALKRKVAIVTYDDGDPENHNGPINSEIFTRCWERAGRPADFFELDQTNTADLLKNAVLGTAQDEQNVRAAYSHEVLHRAMTMAQTSSGSVAPQTTLSANAG